MAISVSNREDVLDSRDIIDRIEELDGTDSETEQEELTTLQKIIEDIRDVSGDSPEDGAALISDSYFEEYARELAEDIGAINRDMNWPLNCIDWEQAAKELKYDYSSIDFDGIEYWVHS